MGRMPSELNIHYRLRWLGAQPRKLTSVVIDFPTSDILCSEGYVWETQLFLIENQVTTRLVRNTNKEIVEFAWCVM